MHCLSCFVNSIPHDTQAEHSFADDNTPAEEWLGFIYLDQAIVNPVAAAENLRTLQRFDGGNSLTNALYWAFSRPLSTAETASTDGGDSRTGFVDVHTDSTLP